MLFEENALALPYILIRLLVEERGDDERLGSLEFVLGEAFFIHRVEGEVENLVPSRHRSLINICRLNHTVPLVILDLDLDIGLYLRSIV